MLSDIRRLGPFLRVQILIFFFWGGGIGDMMTLWAIFGGHRKTGLFLGVISKFKV